MTDTLTSWETSLAADPEDRLFSRVDPVWRAAKRRFGPILVACLLFHLTLLAFLILDDQSNKSATVQQTEIPVEVVVEPPPPPPPPPPPEPKKQEQPKPPEKPKFEAIEKPAFDAPRAPNQEKIHRENTDNKTMSPVQGKPAAANETKPTPDQPKPAQNAAPEPADHTSAPETPKDQADAEPLDKAAPLKEKKAQQKMRQAKQRATLPDDQRAAVARELASLEPSPNFAVASESKVAPVTGGTEDMRYLAVLYGLIMRQQRFPSTPHPRHTTAMVVVAFWVDPSGALTQTALYHTSGYPELDAEAVAAVRRAAPFPEPPPNEPHGFIAQMAFPPK